MTYKIKGKIRGKTIYSNRTYRTKKTAEKDLAHFKVSEKKEKKMLKNPYFKEQLIGLKKQNPRFYKKLKKDKILEQSTFSVVKE